MGRQRNKENVKGSIIYSIIDSLSYLFNADKLLVVFIRLYYTRNLICIADYTNSRVCKDLTGSAVFRDLVTGIQYANVGEDEEDLDQFKSVAEEQSTKKRSSSNKKKS